MLTQEQKNSIFVVVKEQLDHLNSIFKHDPVLLVRAYHALTRWPHLDKMDACIINNIAMDALRPVAAELVTLSKQGPLYISYIRDCIQDALTALQQELFLPLEKINALTWMGLYSYCEFISVFAPKEFARLLLATTIMERLGDKAIASLLKRNQTLADELRDYLLPLYSAHVVHSMLSAVDRNSRMIFATSISPSAPFKLSEKPETFFADCELLAIHNPVECVTRIFANPLQLDKLSDVLQAALIRYNKPLARFVLSNDNVRPQLGPAALYAIFQTLHRIEPALVKKHFSPDADSWSKLGSDLRIVIIRNITFIQALFTKDSAESKRKLHTLSQAEFEMLCYTQAYSLIDHCVTLVSDVTMSRKYPAVREAILHAFPKVNALYKLKAGKPILASDFPHLPENELRVLLHNAHLNPLILTSVILNPPICNQLDQTILLSMLEHSYPIAQQIFDRKAFNLISDAMLKSLIIALASANPAAAALLVVAYPERLGEEVTPLIRRYRLVAACLLLSADHIVSLRKLNSACLLSIVNYGVFNLPNETILLLADDTIYSKLISKQAITFYEVAKFNVGVKQFLLKTKPDFIAYQASLKLASTRGLFSLRPPVPAEPPVPPIERIPFPFSTG